MTNGFKPLEPVAGYTEDQLFADNAASLLTQLEGKKPLPYADSNGIPTVGIGVNLSVPQFAAAYFAEAGISNANEKKILTGVFQGHYASDAKFQATLAKKLSDNGFSSLPPLSDAGIEDLYKGRFQGPRAT